MPSLGVSSLDLTASCERRGLFLAAAPTRLFGRQRQGAEADVGQGQQSAKKARQVVRQRIEAGRLPERALVHLEPAMHLDLQRMQVAARPPVMLRDEAAGVGFVVGDRVAHPG